MANHAGSLAERSAAPRSILVIKPSSLGDVVHTLPAVALLKRHWPESRLRWLINPQWAPLLDGNRSVDELIIFPRDTFRGFLGSVRALRWARRSRSRVRSDLVLDFQGLLRSALIARCWRIAQVVGLSDAREGARFFFDRTVPVDAKTHAVERYLALVAALGVPIRQPLEWPLPAGEKPHGLDGAQRFVVLHPFARGAGKSLSESEVRDFCAGVSPVRVLLAGHHERAGEIADPGSNVLNLVNKTSLSELIWLMRQAAFVVSVDSGPMHIASALGRPLISIHTWSDPRRVGPHRPDAWVLQGGHLSTVAELREIGVGRPIETMRGLGEFVREQLHHKDTPS